MIWPFSRISAWLEWRRRDREEVAVATADYVTTLVDLSGEPTGIKRDHILTFFRDGNGARYSDLQSADIECANRHGDLIRDRRYWKIHGFLPDHAIRCVPRCNVRSFSVIDGGAA